MMFQSTHPRRVWRQGSLSGSTKVCKFQSTHPRRVWPVCPEYYRTRRWFQSTHPRRVWPKKEKAAAKEAKFQSTHPRRVWLITGSYRSRTQRFQSTHPRRVWPIIRAMMADKYKVSIHTPTQGVTSLKIWMEKSESFNPHTHAGCDLMVWQKNPVMQFQSTHPRRVWLVILTRYKCSCCFNPHTHAGCDCLIKLYPATACRFQSTHPRRVWHGGGVFQSRSGLVSIHTPTQGVTYQIVGGNGDEAVSIHTPTQGVTSFLAFF